MWIPPLQVRKGCVDLGEEGWLQGDRQREKNMGEGRNQWGCDESLSSSEVWLTLLDMCINCEMLCGPFRWLLLVSVVC